MTDVETDIDMSALRAALFGVYQFAQWWSLPDRYHFGIRAREVARYR